MLNTKENREPLGEIREWLNVAGLCKDLLDVTPKSQET